MAGKFIEIEGMPIEILLRFPDGDTDEIGGVIVTSKEHGPFQVANALIMTGLEMRKQAAEAGYTPPAHTCPQSGADPRLN